MLAMIVYTLEHGVKGSGNGYQKPDLIAPLAPESCKASLINCLYRDRYNIWIGSYGGGLYRFCPERDFITYFPQEEPLLLRNCRS